MSPVRSSVCPFPIYLSNRLTFGLDLRCVCVGHYHGSQEIETKDQSGKGKGSTRSV